MSKKKIVGLLLIGVTMLTGCGSGAELSSLNDMKAAQSTQYATQSKAMSALDSERQTYERVTARKLLDISTLEKVDASEQSQAVRYMDSFNDGLTGKKDVHVRESETTNYTELNPLNEDLINYLLVVMEQTPYYWQRTSMTIQGRDPDTRAIVADVTYSTIGFKKDVKDNSSIPLGSKNYDKLIKTRYERYMNYLSNKYNGGGGSHVDAAAILKRWEKSYGKAKKVYESQRNLSMLQQVYESGNQITYKGLIDNDAEQSTATMTVRFVITPSYVLGVNTGMTCNQAYILNYSLDSDPTEGLKAFTDEGYQTVTDNVYALLHSYFTAIDESDHNGLYKLTRNYGSLDKSFQDQFDNSYQKHDGYTLTIFNIQGTRITCGVTAAVKQRARGADMTMPMYDDRYLFDIVLDGDNLKVKDMVLISREIVGEPAINEGAKSKKEELSGFTSTIDLSDEDKRTIEQLIIQFSQLQLKRDTSSQDFSKVVDISIPEGDLSTFKTNMMSQRGAKKVITLDNYMSGSKNYALVQCTEQFQSTTNQITEANIQYTFIKKGAEWKIMDYSVMGSIKLDTTNLDQSGALAVLNKDKVLSYTSQVGESASGTTEGKTNASDISTTIAYDNYVPKLKHGNKEHGLLLHTPSEYSSDDKLSDVYNKYFKSLDSPDWGKFKATLDKNSSMLAWFKSCAAYEMNILDDRYSSKSEADKKLTALTQQGSGFTSDDNLDDAISSEIGVIMTNLRPYGGSN